MKGRFGDIVGCQVCWWSISELHDLISNSLIVSIIEDSAVAACSAFLDWSTCSGFVNQCAPMIVDNLLLLNLQQNYFCTDVLEVCPSWDSNYIELDPNNYAT
jgi:hypothetical protein